MKKSVVVLFAAAAVWACTKDPVIADGPVTNVPETSVPDDGNIVSGWVRIKLADDAAPLKTGAFTRGAIDTGDPRLDEIAGQLGATEVKRVFKDGGKFAERRRRYGLHLWYDMKIGEDVPVSRAQSSVASVPGVAHVQPIYTIELTGGEPIPAEVADYRYRPASIDAVRPKLEELPFNDPDLRKQWHYYNDGSLPNAAEGADINLFKGWEITTGTPEVIVAVLDMGVQFDHPDLAANMWMNEAEVNGTPGVDDDNNGYVDDIYGWNFAPGYDSGTIAPGYHGTHIAGTIAAVNNNGIGVCGVAGGSGKGDGARIMTVAWSVDSKSTIPNYDMFAYAADNGAVIASCSWNVQSPEIAPDLQAGLDYFIDNAGTDESGAQTGPMKGGLAMFAAANENKNYLKFPLADERVICVAAMAPDYSKASYTNYAPEVDILAPGGEKNTDEERTAVYSTLTGSGYGYLDGTSMATPHVSGVAALIVSKYGGPGFTRDDLRKRLLGSTRPISPTVPAQYANQLGVGLVDASLITLEDPRTAPQNLEVYGAEGLPDSVRIYCKVPADGNNMPVVKYLMQYAEVRNGAPGQWIKLDLVNTADVGEEYEYGFELVQKTTYAFKMKPVDRFGNEGEEVSFETTTLEHTNRPPRQKAKFLDLESERATERYAKKFQLQYYFIEPDESYGDELSFTASSSDPEVAEIIMEDGGKLTIMPLKKGVATITVRATDKGGLYVEVSFKLTVLNDAYTNEPPMAIKHFGSIRMEGVGEDHIKRYSLPEYFTDPNLADGDALTFAVADNSDETIVKAEINGDNLVLTPLAHGKVSIVITATDKAGASAKGTMTIEVGRGVVPSGGELTLASNPVGEALVLGLAPAAGKKAAATIYDAAARKVISAEIAFDGNGRGTLDVASLSPGVYTLAIQCEAGKYKVNFLKK